MAERGPGRFILREDGELVPADDSPTRAPPAPPPLPSRRTGELAIPPDLRISAAHGLHETPLPQAHPATQAREVGANLEATLPHAEREAPLRPPRTADLLAATLAELAADLPGPEASPAPPAHRAAVPPGPEASPAPPALRAAVPPGPEASPAPPARRAAVPPGPEASPAPPARRAAPPPGPEANPAPPARRAAPPPGPKTSARRSAAGGGRPTAEEDRFPSLDLQIEEPEVPAPREGAGGRAPPTAPWTSAALDLPRQAAAPPPREAAPGPAPAAGHAPDLFARAAAPRPPTAPSSTADLFTRTVAGETESRVADPFAVTRARTEPLGADPFARGAEPRHPGPVVSVPATRLEPPSATRTAPPRAVSSSSARPIPVAPLESGPPPPVAPEQSEPRPAPRRPSLLSRPIKEKARRTDTGDLAGPSGSLPPQAQLLLEQALSEHKAGNLSSASNSLKLARSYAPNDPRILRALERLAKGEPPA